MKFTCWRGRCTNGSAVPSPHRKVRPCHMPHTICHVPHTMCHMPYATYHMPYAICHMPSPGIRQAFAGHNTRHVLCTILLVEDSTLLPCLLSNKDAFVHHSPRTHLPVVPPFLALFPCLRRSPTVAFRHLRRALHGAGLVLLPTAENVAGGRRVRPAGGAVALAHSFTHHPRSLSVCICPSWADEGSNPATHVRASHTHGLPPHLPRWRPAAAAWAASPGAREWGSAGCASAEAGAGRICRGPPPGRWLSCCRRRRPCRRCAPHITRASLRYRKHTVHCCHPHI